MYYLIINPITNTYTQSSHTSLHRCPNRQTKTCTWDERRETSRPSGPQTAAGHNNHRRVAWTQRYQNKVKRRRQHGKRQTETRASGQRCVLAWAIFSIDPKASSSQLVQQVHKHTPRFPSFCLVFCHFSPLLTSLVAMLSVALVMLKGKRTDISRALSPVFLAPLCWKIERNRHQNHFALSSFSLWRSHSMRCFLASFFFKPSNDEQVRALVSLPALWKWGQRRKPIRTDKGSVTFICPSTEVYIADGGIFYGARAHKPSTHTQGSLSVGELVVRYIQLRKSPHHHMAHPPSQISKASEVILCLYRPAVWCLILILVSVVLPDSVHKRQHAHELAFMNSAPWATTQPRFPLWYERCLKSWQNRWCTSAISPT